MDDHNAVHFPQGAQVRTCDGCRGDFHLSLLTRIGCGILLVCRDCLPEALATISTAPRSNAAAQSA